MVTKSEFHLLYDMKTGSPHRTQRDLATSLGMSLGNVNRIIHVLTDKKMISDRGSQYALTEAGEEALEQFRVKNAVIMAAGMSSRFVPLSYEKPKGLLVVRGEILIEREIRQLQEAGITDITVVVGYMKEQFFYLEDKFNVKVVVNEDYYRYNNTSTLMRVLDKLSNTYICSSDNYFVDNVFEPYVYRAYYSAVYAPGDTNEYCLKCDQSGKIRGVSIGGSKCWYMLGHVYFDKKFSDKFRQILQAEYGSQETKEHLWEDLYMRHTDQLEMYIRKYDADKVWEFDSLEELRFFDSEYVNNADSGILKNICRVLNCQIKDIVDVKAIKAGLTNTSFCFSVGDGKYVYRHPGRGTEKYINRKSEAFSMQLASGLGLDDTFIFIDPDKGWKISRFIPNARELDYHNAREVDKALQIMRTLHKARVRSDYDFGIREKTEEFVRFLKDTDRTDSEDFAAIYKAICKVGEYVCNDRYAVKCLCHNDCYSPNFLLDGQDKMYLIDWEYSGNDDPASDLGTFICCSDYSYEEATKVLEKYLEHTPDREELGHYIGYIAIASFYWYVWALYQECRGNAVGEWLLIWYKNSKLYAGKSLELCGLS